MTAYHRVCPCQLLCYGCLLLMAIMVAAFGIMIEIIIVHRRGHGSGVDTLGGTDHEDFRCRPDCMCTLLKRARSSPG